MAKALEVGDTASVDLSLTQVGSPTSGREILKASVRRNPRADNALVQTREGLIVPRARVTAGAGVSVSGDGSTADPYVVSAGGAGGGGGPVKIWTAKGDSAGPRLTQAIFCAKVSQGASNIRIHEADQDRVLVLRNPSRTRPMILDITAKMAYLAIQWPVERPAGSSATANLEAVLTMNDKDYATFARYDTASYSNMRIWGQSIGVYDYIIPPVTLRPNQAVRFGFGFKGSRSVDKQWPCGFSINYQDPIFKVVGYPQ